MIVIAMKSKPPSPPPHRNLGSFTPAKTGRPPKWCYLLASFKRRQKVVTKPYKNESTAVAAASWFNAQMREHDPEAYEAGIRFRSKGLRIVVKRVKVLHD